MYPDDLIESTFKKDTPDKSMYYTMRMNYPGLQAGIMVKLVSQLLSIVAELLVLLVAYVPYGAYVFAKAKGSFGQRLWHAASWPARPIALPALKFPFSRKSR